jgi:ketosteroid isomerase-like protein
VRSVVAAVLATVAVAIPLAQPVAVQQARDPFIEMADTERAFAARAKVVGWKQSFLEFFADDAVGFDGGAGPAKDQIRKNPDPPSDFQLLWEPRFGDIAASGELGWLTGPSTSINPARPTRYGAYASVWKRQADGTFKVIIDVGITSPGPITFAPGLTRASRTDRYTGEDTVQQATQALALADAAVNANAIAQPEGLLSVLAIDGRLHRNGWDPFIGRAGAEIGANKDPEVSRTSRFAEVATSRDLGHTWGTAGAGYYTRVWTRTRSGAWRIALDVLLPGPA